MLQGSEHVVFSGGWDELKEEFLSESLARPIFRTIFDVLRAMATGHVVYVSTKLKLGEPLPSGKIYQDHFEMTLDWSMFSDADKKVQISLWYGLSCHYFQALLTSGMIKGFYPSMRASAISYTVTF